VQSLEIVRVLRQRERKGLIAARLLGAREAGGEVLAFLDSHCEYITIWDFIERSASQPLSFTETELTGFVKVDILVKL